MSTLEYGTYQGPPLEGERLHRCLIDLQDATIRKHHLKRPSLSVAEYEDLYARAMLVLLEKHPDASFPAPQAVVSWLDTTIANSAIDILRRRNLGRETNDVISVSDTRPGEDEPNVLQPVDAAPTPEQHVLLNEESLTLREFIASLAPQDRKISLLHLHPGSRMKLKQIAAALNLPVTEVNTVLKRVDKRFSRYVALEVDAVCALRERDLVTWKRTGEMPPALRWHTRRCSTCSAKIEAARGEVYRSLLPIVGAIGLPAAGGIGVFSRFYGWLGSRPLVIRANDGLPGARKAGAFGASSSGALVTAKTVFTTAVVATAAAGAGVAVVHSIGGTPRPHGTPPSSKIATHTTAATTTHRAPALATSAVKRRLTTTTTSTTTRPTTTPRRARSTPARSTPTIVHFPPTAATTSSTATTTPSEPKSAAPSKPTSSTLKHTAPPARTRQQTTKSTSGGLPDLQQTEQQP
jgi:RNA polymerase sigma factor (sigma-70 family)